MISNYDNNNLYIKLIKYKFINFLVLICINYFNKTFSTKTINLLHVFAAAYPP